MLTVEKNHQINGVNLHTHKALSKDQNGQGGGNMGGGRQGGMGGGNRGNWNFCFFSLMWSKVQDKLSS